MTDRHTNASSGKVVSIFKPKQLLQLVRPIVSIGCQDILQSRKVDHDVVGWKVVEHVALGLRAKEKESRYSHCQAHQQRDSRGIMGHHRETVHGWFLQGTIDEKTIMIF